MQITNCFLGRFIYYTWAELTSKIYLRAQIDRESSDFLGEMDVL